MNECECCALAELKPHSGLIHAGCRGCEARSLAKCQDFADSAEANVLTPTYRSALKAVAGADWLEFHNEVKRWAAILKANQ